MSSLLAVIGVLALGKGAVTSQLPRFGGLYEFEGKRYTFPNGDTWGPIKGYVFLTATDKGQTLIYLPGTKNAFIGTIGNNFISAKAEVLGADFVKAPRVIQETIDRRALQRDLSLAISDNGLYMSGKIELLYASWSGDKLNDITAHPHDVLFSRVECQVKDFKFLTQDFDKLADQLLPERKKRLTDAETVHKDALARFNKSVLDLQETLPPIGNAVRAAAVQRQSIPVAIADIATAGDNLSNAAHKALVRDIDRMVTRKRQIADRITTIRRDMPNTPANVIRQLQDESAALDRQLAPKRQQRDRLEFRLGIEPAKAKAKVEVENRELGLLRLLQNLDAAKTARDQASADVVAKLDAFYRTQEDLSNAISRTRFEPSRFAPKVDRVAVEAGKTVFEAKPDHPFESVGAVRQRIDGALQNIRRVNQSLETYRQDFTELKRQMLLDADAMIRTKFSSAYAEDPIKVNQTNNEIMAACLTNTVNDLSNLIADEIQKTPLITSTEWDDFFSYRLMAPGGSDIYPAELASTVFVRRRGRDFLQWDFVDRVNRFVAADPRVTQLSFKSALADAPFGKSNQVVKDSWKLLAQTLNQSLELPWRRSLSDSLTGEATVAAALQRDTGLATTRMEKLLDIRNRYRTQLNDKSFTDIADVAMVKVNTFLPLTAAPIESQRRVIWRRTLKNGARIKAVGLVIQRLQQAKWEIYSEMQHLLEVQAHLHRSMDLLGLKIVSNPKFYPTQLPTVKVVLDRDSFVPTGDSLQTFINRTALTSAGLYSDFLYPNNPAGHQALAGDWNLEIRFKAR